MIHILGAGVSGLSAAKVLREFAPIVFEANPVPISLDRPMRFRTPAVGKLFGLEFERVWFQKGYEEWRSPVADALALTRKCFGVTMNTPELLVAQGMHERFLSPLNLFERMREGNLIMYENYDFSIRDKKVPLVSTIPMPRLMAALGYECKEEFRQVESFTVRARVKDFNAYATVFLPSPRTIAARVQVFGDMVEVFVPRPGMSAEAADYWRWKWTNLDWKRCMEHALAVLGEEQPEYVGEIIVEQDKHKKFLRIDERERLKFIQFARQEHNIYCIGRHAQWWPGMDAEEALFQIQSIKEQLENGGGRLN